MVEFQVAKMNCGGCANRVTKAVQQVDSLAKIDIDLKGKTVRIESKATLQALALPITEAGYPVLASATV